MKVTTIRARDLSAEHAAAWSNIQEADRSLDSPFFCPEFTQTVAAVRDDVEVAILEEGGTPVGFFPFQRSPSNVGRPVGGRLSDFQGIVGTPGVSCDPQLLIRGCRLRAWYFDHLLQSQTDFAPFQWAEACSPFIDLRTTYETYLQQRRSLRATDVMQALNKKKKADRQCGPVRFELRTTDQHVLDTLIEWKSEQYRRLKFVNLFSFPWTLALLKHLFAMGDNPKFTGVLSALFLGDRLAAAHFGMRSGRVLHWWFTAYDPELGKYSPGSQLLLELVRAAGPMGVERIDLGKGLESYKRSFMNGAIPLAEGSIDSRPMIRAAQQAWHRAKRKARESRYRQLALGPWRLFARVRDQIQFR